MTPVDHLWNRDTQIFKLGLKILKASLPNFSVMADKIGKWFETISDGHLLHRRWDVLPSFYVVTSDTVVGMEPDFERQFPSLSNPAA